MEQLPIAAVSGALGGLTGKFAARAWDLGAKWLSTYFKDHAPRAREKAEQNSLDFMNQLAERVKQLEHQGEEFRKRIEDSLDEPDFSVLLQKAVLSSAQTDDKRKHEILARLVSGRLTRPSDSLLALTGKLACDAVPMLNDRHLKMLGLLTVLVFIRPDPFPSHDVARQMQDVAFREWLTGRLQVYQDLPAPLPAIDYLHLESLSCVKWDPVASRNLEAILSPPREAGFTLDYRAFVDTEVGRKVKELWNSGLQHALPTTVGMVIGACVSDVLTGDTTYIDTWGESRGQQGGT